MPAPASGSRSHVVTGVTATSGGAGPNASFVTGSYHTPSPAAAPAADFSNVGKFNMSVVSPGAAIDAQTNNMENASIIHGLAQGFAGEHVGSPLGRTPLGLPIRAAANVFDAVAAPFGDLLGNIGSLGQPYGAALNAVTFLQKPDSPEKRLAEAEIEKNALNPMEVARIQAKYLTDLDVRSADPNETGLFAFNPALREANPFNAHTVGGLVEGLGNALFSIPLLVERGVAGFGGTEGSQVEQILRKDPAALNDMQRKMVENVTSGKWSKEKAADYLVANNAGYTQDAGVNIALTFLLDPTVWGTMGAGLLAKAGTSLAMAPRLIAIAEKGLEAARASGVPGEVERAEASLNALKAARPGAQATGLLPDVTGRLANTFIGQASMKVMADPLLGPIARIAHNVIDPTRLIFKEANPADRIVKSHLALEGTMAVTEAYGEKNVHRVYALLDQLHPGLASRVAQSAGEYTGGLVRQWAAREEGRELIKRNFNELDLGSTVQRVNKRLEALPNDIGIHLGMFAREVTPLTVNADEIATRMAAAYGGTAADYAKLVGSLNHEGLAYLHAVTTAAARTDLLKAVGIQASKGTWKLKQDIQKTILIGPGELTTKRAKALLSQLNTLKGSERLAAAKDAIEQYDILRDAFEAHTDLAVSELRDHVKTLMAEGALSSEMTPNHLTSLTGEVADWMGRYGTTVDGKPLYGLGFRPRDEKLWRLIFDKQTGDLKAINPWVDYVMESAPGYRPGAFNVTGIGPLAAVPGVQKFGDWYVLGRDMLMHQVSTARVELEARRRFYQIGMKMGMTAREVKAVHGALEKARVGGAYEVTMRAMASERIWQEAERVIPSRLLTGENAITRRQMMNMVFDAYKNELRIVGGTQLLTGQLKKLVDNLPGMQALSGGNLVGQVAEGLWPNLKFRINPIFQYQEGVEGQFFGVAKGIKPYFRGKVTDADERAFKVWGTWDKGLEGVGDQIENSISPLQGHMAGTLEKSTGLKRIKYVNAVRQYRKYLGEEVRKFMPEAQRDELKAFYGTYDDGEMAVRYLTDQTASAQDVLHALDRNDPNAYTDLIASAAWNKPITQGGLAPLHMDFLARRMGYKDGTSLIKAVRSPTEALTKTDVASHLTGLGANPEYTNRVMHALDWKGVDTWWRAVKKAFRLSDTEVSFHRTIMRAAASLHGMNEGEYLSQKFANKVGRFTKVEDIGNTDDALLMAVHQELRDKGKTIYDLDNPEVQALLTRAREMRDMTDMGAKNKATVQRAHDRVLEDPRPYRPGGPVRAHTVTMPDGTTRTMHTGDLGWEEVKALMEHLPGEAGNAARNSANWYNELPGVMLAAADGDVEVGAKMLLGFLYTQKAQSPVQGMRLVLRALDRYKFTADNVERFFTEDLQLSKEVYRKVMLGEPITEGLGAKLFDFTDAGLLRPTRFIDTDLAPTPSDRWMLRARGHMDVKGLDQFLKTYGYENATAAGFLDPRPFRYATGKLTKTGKPAMAFDKQGYEGALKTTGLQRVMTSVTDAQYEETTRWTNDMAKAANAENWLGKSNWTGTEFQATLWNAAQHAVDAYPEAGADMIFHNQTQLALSVTPSARGPFHSLLRDWSNMTAQEQMDLAHEMAAQTAHVFTQRLGVPVTGYFGGMRASHLGIVQPSFTLIIQGTGETIDRALLSGLATLGQDHAIAIREMPGAVAKYTKKGKLTGGLGASRPEQGVHRAIDFVIGDRRSPISLPGLSGEVTQGPYATRGRLTSEAEVNQLRDEGTALYDSLGKRTRPLTNVEAPDLYDRTVTQHDPANDYWGGASYNPRNGEYLSAAPSRWMYHGTTETGLESIQQSTMRTGDFTYNLDDKMLRKDGPLLRAKESFITGRNQKFPDQWKTAAGIKPEALEVSRDGGLTWKPLVPGAEPASVGPWTASVAGTTKSIPAEEARIPEAFNAAYHEFVAENEALLQKSEHFVGTFFDEAKQAVEFDVVVAARTEREAEALQVAMNTRGGAFNMETFQGLFGARDVNSTTDAIAALPSMAGEGFMPFKGTDGLTNLRSVFRRADGKATTDAQTRARLKQLRQEMDDAGLSYVGLDVKGVHVVEHEQDWLADPRGRTIAERLGTLGPGGEHARDAIYGRVLPEGRVEQPLIGEFRTITDDHIRDHLGGDATRGRNPIVDATPEAAPGVEEGFSEGDFYVWQSQHEESREITGYAANRMGIPGYTTRYPRTLFSRQEEGDRLLDGVYRSGGGDVPLYSGQRPSNPAERTSETGRRIAIPSGPGIQKIPKVGETISIPLKGTSTDPQVAGGFLFGRGGGNLGQGFMYEFPVGTKGVWADSQGVETVVSGRFKVTGYRQVPADELFVHRAASSQPPVPVFTLEQTHVFNPTTDQWEKLKPRSLQLSTREPRTLPPVPGETPLPPGMVRAYHYTSSSKDPLAALTAIRSEGLRQGAAKGETYGEPNQIWMSSQKPDGSHHFVEVHLRPEEITGSGSPPMHLLKSDYSGDRVVVTPRPGSEAALAEWADNVNARGANFAVYGQDIPPERIVSYNEPWMHEYRTLVERGPTDPAEFRQKFSAWLMPSRADTHTGQAVAKRLEDLEAGGGGVPPDVLKNINGDTHGFTPHPDAGSDGTEAMKMSNEGHVRGATTLMKDGRAILWASRDSADSLTFAHEMAHVMHSHLDPSMRDALITQYNAETGRRTRVWSRATSEWFADSYLRALREGVTADHPEIQRAYNFFSKFMNKAIATGEKRYAAGAAYDSAAHADAYRATLRHEGDDIGSHLPEPAPGTKRLYRGEGGGGAPAGDWWSDSPSYALQHAGEHGTLHYVDVPASTPLRSDGVAELDKRLTAGRQRVFTQGGDFTARGALAPQETASLMAPMRPQNRAMFDEMLKGPTADAHPWNHTEEMTYQAMTDAAKQAGYDAFRVNFFKRNRSVLERTVNHPMFGLYPASYMWGKVLPELVRFMAKDPFGMPGGHVAWAADDIYHSLLQQSAADPEFAKWMDAMGKNGVIRLIALTFPATPWEMPVNAAAWTRRIAQAGLEAEARYNATGQDQKGPDFLNIWKDTMGYQFGAIPNAFNAVGQLATGGEDFYSSVTGEPTKGKKAPSIGAGLNTIGQNLDQTFAPIGQGLPSLTDVLGGGTTQNLQDDLSQQNTELQTQLEDAQSQLQDIFAQYPFTQQ